MAMVVAREGPRIAPMWVLRAWAGGFLPQKGDASRPSGGDGGRMSENYDVIIIGTGAGGGTLAHTLAGSGKRILLLERGDFLPREMDNWDPEPVFVDGQVHLQGHLVRRATASRSSPRSTTSSAGPPSSTAPPCTGCGPQDFGELKHVDGISPAWPLSYDDFEPWYSQGRVAVPGARQRTARTRPRATGRSSTRGRAVSHEPRIQQISDDLATGGYHPFHAPCGILLDEADRPRSTCIRCTWCDGYPCLVHAKSDAEVIAVRPAARTGRTSRCSSAPR